MEFQPGTAPTPCDSWMGLDQYESNDHGNIKSAWFNQQKDLIAAANKKVLQRIKEATNKDAWNSKVKPLRLHVGDLVLMTDHGEGHRKIQNRYKSEIYVITGLHKIPEVYFVKPFGSTKTPKAVNRRLLHTYSGIGVPGKFKNVPHYNARALQKSKPKINQSPYFTRSRAHGGTAV